MSGYSAKELEKINNAEVLKKENERNGIYYCTRDDANYPQSLRGIKNSPALIYYRGNIKIANDYKSIAVIGSRKCSEYGKQLSYETSKYLTQKGINIVNGLALGCDTFALRGALDNNGRCMVWMPCGLDNIQPKNNRNLADEIIAKGGCLLSEYPVGTEIKKYNYVERDRLQSGISQGVIVIEADRNSGTMHTADFAVSQYRRLACYYHRLLENATGNKYLEDSADAKVIRQLSNLEEFANEILHEGQYEQLSLCLQ